MHSAALRLVTVVAVSLIVGSCRTDGPVGTEGAVAPTAPTASTPLLSAAQPPDFRPITEPIAMQVRPFDCQRVEAQVTYRVGKGTESHAIQFVYTADVFGTPVEDMVAVTVQNTWSRDEAGGFGPRCRPVPTVRMLVDAQGDILDTSTGESDRQTSVRDTERDINEIVQDTVWFYALLPDGGVRTGDVINQRSRRIGPVPIGEQTTIRGLAEYRGRQVLVGETTGQVRGTPQVSGSIRGFDLIDVDTGLRIGGSSIMELSARIDDPMRMHINTRHDVIGACDPTVIVDPCADFEQTAATPVFQNSCHFAFDGDCDEPGRGTGLCLAGTDTSDCSLPQGPNSCQFAFDGQCDHPGEGSGSCPPETDQADCGIPERPTASAGPVSPAGPMTPIRPAAPASPADPANSCRFAFDGDCDEPGRGTGLCAAGTDTRDCALAQGPNSCQFAFDGECDHPGSGTGACPPNTDQADCRVPARATGAVGPGDSCRWALNGRCEDTAHIGAVAGCRHGTDKTDCAGLQLRPDASMVGNACAWAFDNECDETRYVGAMTAACEHGTDTADCRGLELRSARDLAGNECQWAFDGECDHPGVGTGVCRAGTDTADCASGPTANSCNWAFDGECDERGIGTGLCAVGTDTADCRPG